jgi:predicted Zn-dependent protease with MMP-like domain
MEADRFQRLVEEAVESLPRQFAERMENVAVMVQDLASPEQLARLNLRDPHQLLGLYEGVPLTDRPQGYAGALPDRITIFRVPIERQSGDDDEVRENVRKTVMHELGHYFGMDEEMLRDI